MDIKGVNEVLSEATRGMGGGKKELSYALEALVEIGKETVKTSNDLKAGRKKQAAQGLYDVLSLFQSVVFNAFGSEESSPVSDALTKVRRAVFALEKKQK